MGVMGWPRRKGETPGTHTPRTAPLAHVAAGLATDRGPRATNEDWGTVSARWALVSDGAGGHAGGEIASELAIQAALALLGRSPGEADEDLVVRAFKAANAAVRAGRRANPGLSAMASTLTIAARTSSEAGSSHWVIANLGDSPLWQSSGGRLTRLSEEHNLAAELVRAGALTPDTARSHPGRHMITRALGLANDVVPHMARAVLHPGDLLLVASDGLEVLTEAEIAAVIARTSDALSTARALVQEALSAGTTDNVTVAVLEHLATLPEDLPPGTGTPDPAP